MNSDAVIAATIACEVPPYPTHDFGALAVSLAIEAVCEVIRNRAGAASFPTTPVEVVLEPKAFSCVLTKAWIGALAGSWHPAHVQRCLEVWQTPREPPIVGGATHYFSPISMSPPGRVPFWAGSMREVVVPGIPQKWFRWFRS